MRFYSARTRACSLGIGERLQCNAVASATGGVATGAVPLQLGQPTMCSSTLHRRLQMHGSREGVRSSRTLLLWGSCISASPRSLRSGARTVPLVATAATVNSATGGHSRGEVRASAEPSNVTRSG
jgi:hypothetical protein